MKQAPECQREPYNHLAELGAKPFDVSGKPTGYVKSHLTRLKREAS